MNQKSEVTFQLRTKKYWFLYSWTCRKCYAPEQTPFCFYL